MLRSKEQVEEWAQANGGEEAVRIARDQRRFGQAQEAYAYVNAWLIDQEEGRRAAAAEADRQFRLREVVASEKAADAADRSARSARHSAIVAAIATLIALAALVAPYLKTS